MTIGELPRPGFRFWFWPFLAALPQATHSPSLSLVTRGGLWSQLWDAPEYSVDVTETALQ